MPDATVTVESVDCMSASSSGGTRLAAVRDSLGNNTKVGISFTVDSATREIVWQTS